MPIELYLDIEPDENQMVDGLSAAYEIIKAAVKYINPYVDDNSASLEAVFMHIANTALGDVQEDIKAGGERLEYSSMVVCHEPDEVKRQTIIERSIADRHEVIRAIIELHAAGQAPVKA